MSNTNLHINLNQPLSKQHIQYLQNLPDHQGESSRRLGPSRGAHQVDPTQRQNRPTRSSPYSTKEELALAVQDCYKKICSNRTEVTYMVAIKEAVVDRVYYDGTGIQEAAEQLIFLASRVITGEGCADHVEYESPTHGTEGIHD